MSIILEQGRQTARAVRAFGREQISISSKLPISVIDERLANFSTMIFSESVPLASETPHGKLVTAHSDEIKNLIFSCNLDDIYVFGSVASGEDTPTSDIDFIVTGNYNTFAHCVISLATSLKDILSVDVDVVHPNSFTNFATFIAYSEIRSL